MANNKRDWSISRDAVKALVAVYGPREAARQAGVPLGTISSWCTRYKWRKAERLPRTTGINGQVAISNKDAGDALRDAIQGHKEESTLNLAHYVSKASRAARESKQPLEIARKVHAVSQVYATLFPEEKQEGLIESAILVGASVVTDNTQEMLANVPEAKSP